MRMRKAKQGVLRSGAERSMRDIEHAEKGALIGLL